MTRRPDIHLRIDALELEGFPPAQRAAVARAVRRELAAVLAERSLPMASDAGAVPSGAGAPGLGGRVETTGRAEPGPQTIGPQTIGPTTGRSAGSIGREVARSVHAALSQGQGVRHG